MLINLLNLGFCQRYVCTCSAMDKNCPPSGTSGARTVAGTDNRSEGEIPPVSPGNSSTVQNIKSDRLELSAEIRELTTFWSSAQQWRISPLLLGRIAVLRS